MDADTNLLTADVIAGALAGQCKAEWPDSFIHHFLIAEAGTLERCLVIVCTTDSEVERYLKFKEDGAE